MVKLLFPIISLFIFGEFAVAYKTGAPPEVCESMIPEHGLPPQNTSFPYTLTVDKNKIKSGSKIILHVVPKKSSETFKGFFIQARDSKDKPVGTFTQISGSKVINCPPGTQNAITHVNTDEKSTLTVTWTSPQNQKGPVSFRVTIAKNGEIFWVGARSQRIFIE